VNLLLTLQNGYRSWHTDDESSFLGTRGADLF
jgi:hypothetical protein